MQVGVGHVDHVAGILNRDDQWSLRQVVLGQAVVFSAVTGVAELSLLADVGVLGDDGAGGKLVGLLTITKNSRENHVTRDNLVHIGLVHLDHGRP